MKSIYGRIPFMVVRILMAIFVSSALLVGCDTNNTLILSESDEIFGKSVYLNGEKCAYTSDDENVYITCGPLEQIESETDPFVYYAVIEKIGDVYDADTITDVLVLLHKFDDPKTENLLLWPNIERYTDGIYSRADIRIYGIDAPEMRNPTVATLMKNDESLSKEEAEAIRTRLEERGVKARNFLRDLVARSVIDGVEQAIEIHISDEAGELYGADKYGRILANIFCYHDGTKINVAEALLEARHAVPYDGGTKTFDWGAEVLDFGDTVDTEE